MTVLKIEVNKITSDRGRRDQYNDSDEDNVRPQTETTPCGILVDSIRCWYPRRDNRPGTRITFRDGGGFAVTESKAEIDAMLAAL